MSDSEGTTTDDRENGTQNMPSVTTQADVFSAALAPVLSQMTKTRVSAQCSFSGHDESDEDGEAASAVGPARPADMNE